MAGGAPIHHERAGPQLEVASGSLRGRTVLVVDDEQLVREAVTRMLARIGVRPITVETGAEALRRLERDASVVDVVLLDMMMPEMNGEETFEEIHRRYPSLPVILSSGYDEVEGSGRAAGHGLAGFIHKPYRLGELQRVLERVLAD